MEEDATGRGGREEIIRLAGKQKEKYKAEKNDKATNKYKKIRKKMRYDTINL